MSSINQAKAEAQKLIKRYNKLQAEAKNADAAEAARKASEAEKLVSQISALQAAITKLQAKDRQQLPATGTSTVRPIGKTDGTDEGMTPEELKRAAEEKALLEARIARIESAQQRTRAQIEQLSRAKQELARLKHEAEQNAAREKREQDERLQQELAKLIEKKENEQETLRRELDNIRQQAEKDAELLRIQRDAARAAAEKHKQEQAVNRSLGIVRRKSNNGMWIGLGIGVVLAGGLVAVALFTNVLDDYLPHKKTPVVAGNAPPIQTAPTGNAIAENTANQVSSSSAANTQASAPNLPTATEAVPVKALGEFQDSLRSGGRGPMMVKLPSGTFLMGSRDSLPYSDEKPQHQVTLNNYSISKFEITFTDYDRFVRATDYTSPDDMGWGRSNRPVVNVTWDDAVEYTKWLSTETGKLYRLPSEREWEYAAKAGTDSTYWWGMDLIPNRANCGVCGSEWDGRQTAPIGSFQANEFGLHDTIGNVLEWTLDCARPTYDNAPPTGQFWEGGDCSRRVVRSSSYRSFKANLRTTKREMYPSKRKSDTLGFRVVRVE